MEKGKILLIEEDRADAGRFHGLLTDEGYEVTCVYNGKEALGKAQGVKFNLVISELVLPDMKGEEVCRLLKRKKRYKRPPVIVLSVKDEVEDIEGALAKGADDYIIKPPRPEHLLRKVSQHLRLDRTK